MLEFGLCLPGLGERPGCCFLFKGERGYRAHFILNEPVCMTELLECCFIALCPCVQAGNEQVKARIIATYMQSLLESVASLSQVDTAAQSRIRQALQRVEVAGIPLQDASILPGSRFTIAGVVQNPPVGVGDLWFETTSFSPGFQLTSGTGQITL